MSTVRRFYMQSNTVTEDPNFLIAEQLFIELIEELQQELTIATLTQDQRQRKLKKLQRVQRELRCMNRIRRSIIRRKIYQL